MLVKDLDAIIDRDIAYLVKVSNVPTVRSHFKQYILFLMIKIFQKYIILVNQLVNLIADSISFNLFTKDLIMTSDEILTKMLEGMLAGLISPTQGEVDVKIEGLKTDGNWQGTTVEKITVNPKFSQNEGVIEDKDE